MSVYLNIYLVIDFVMTLRYPFKAKKRLVTYTLTCLAISIICFFFIYFFSYDHYYKVVLLLYVINISAYVLLALLASIYALIKVKNSSVSRQASTVIL